MPQPAAHSLHAELLLRQEAILGEGPLWHVGRQELLWVDIMQSRLHRLDPASGRTTTLSLPEHAGSVVPRRRGGVMVAMASGFAAVNLDSGAVSDRIAVVHPQAGMRFNDGKCDAQGRFWAGSMAYDCRQGAGSLYRLDRQHQVMPMLDGVTISNGLVWNREASIMYYIDTALGGIDAFRFDAETGTIHDRRTITTFTSELGVPDGMTMDEEGMLWVALHDAGGVGRFDPRTGRLLVRIQVPSAKLVTACAFGGPHLDTLYITTARIGLDPAGLVDQPLAGSLFAVRPGVRGIPANEYAG